MQEEPSLVATGVVDIKDHVKLHDEVILHINFAVQQKYTKLQESNIDKISSKLNECYCKDWNIKQDEIYEEHNRRRNSKHDVVPSPLTVLPDQCSTQVASCRFTHQFWSSAL